MAPIKPAVQPSTENYPAQEHEHMQNLTTQNYDPNAATEVIDAWVQFGTKFRELAHDFNKIVNDSHGGWNGAAAEGVRLALTKVSKFADDTGTAFHTTAGAIATQRDAAVQANRSMPALVEFSPLKIAGKWAGAAIIAPPAVIGGAVEMIQTHNEKQEAKQEAVRVMQQRDTTMMSAAQSMPAMDATPQVTQDQGVTQASSTTHSQSLSNASTFRPPASTGMPSIPPPGTGSNTTNPAWVAPPANQPTIPPGTDPRRNPGGNQNRPPIGPPGMLPPGMRPPGGGQTGRPGGGNQTGKPGNQTGGPGGGGPGAGRGGAGGRGMGPGGMAGVGGSGRGMGTFGPANPGGSAGVMGNGPGGAGPGAGTGTGAAGRAGTAAGAGGMGAGGAGKGGEEDKEHKSNYLVPTDEFFDDDRMVSPPVIGG